MQSSTPPSAVSVLTLILLLASPHFARAVVNPSLQPVDLYERNANVISLRVASIDEDAMTVTMDVIERPKGEFSPKQVLLQFRDDVEVKEAFQTLLAPDQVMVAYWGVGGRGRRAGGGAEIRLYLASGVWAIATAKEQNATSWSLAEILAPEGTRSLFGTYNGHGERLAEMMRDAAVGKVFFPAVPFAQFEEGRSVGKLPAPATGLALYDLDADGDLDITAVSTEAVRVFMQAKPMQFQDATAASGLEAARGASVAIADVNADGKPDVLIGGRLYLGAAGAKFEPADGFSAGPGEIKHAFFAQINGDGMPDIVVSRSGSGLSVYLNDGGKFRDASADVGLPAIEGVARGNGFAFAGDWNGDGRGDLFYAIGRGLLLVQGATGKFEAAARTPNYDFTTGGETAGRTGGGTFAPLWRADSADLIFASEANVNFAINQKGRAVDATGYANEITESKKGMTAVLAEDLDADGYVDVYAINGGGFENFLYSNRGYGSFMAPGKYTRTMFPGRAHAAGSTAAVAGDVDGDGANDLVLALPDGAIELLRNATLSSRRKQEHPNAQQKVLNRISVLTVNVKGSVGVSGARVQLKDESGTVTAQREIGGHDLPGSRGPDAVNLAVRNPGHYTLAVRWADGTTREWKVDLTKPADRRAVEADRPAK